MTIRLGTCSADQVMEFPVTKDARATTNSGAESARLVKLQEMAPSTGAGKSVFDANFELIQNLKVKLSVGVGQVEVSVAELFGLKEGAVLKLVTLTDEPLDITLDGKVVARGELVVVGDHFGIRITELARPTTP